MRIALIGCMVLSREIGYAISQGENYCRPYWLKQGLHNTPDLLRESLQKVIDEIEEEQQNLSKNMRYDAICLAYGLCSNGVVGLTSRTIKLVVPKCDDCISLFLGSAKRYREIFSEKPGIYWYNPGWIENAFTPSAENYEMMMKQYIELYGEDNAEYLIEMETGWTSNYQNCVYIDSPVYNSEKYEGYTKSVSQHFGWEYSKEKGDMRYINKLLNGEWEEEFLVCESGYKIEPDYSDNKIKAVKA